MEEIKKAIEDQGMKLLKAQAKIMNLLDALQQINSIASKIPSEGTKEALEIFHVINEVVLKNHRIENET